jgi:hypothetical protein
VKSSPCSLSNNGRLSLQGFRLFTYCLELLWDCFASSSNLSFGLSSAWLKRQRKERVDRVNIIFSKMLVTPDQED